MLLLRLSLFLYHKYLVFFSDESQNLPKSWLLRFQVVLNIKHSEVSLIKIHQKGSKLIIFTLLNKKDKRVRSSILLILGVQALYFEWFPQDTHKWRQSWL